MIRNRFAYALVCLSVMMLACGKGDAPREDASQAATAAGDSSATEGVASSAEGEEESETATTASSGSGSCGKFLDEYDAWADSYVAFMKDYKKNPTDAGMISRLTEMSSRSTSMASEAQSADCTSGADAQRMLRIQQKIASAM